MPWPLDPLRSPAAGMGPLSRRLAVVLAARVLLFTGAWGTVAFVLSSSTWEGGIWESSVYWVGLSALVVYLTTLVAAIAIRKKFRLPELVMGQLLLDQALWTVVVSVSGGVVSGATSLYGVTCLAGGFLLGSAGAIVTALAGGVFFSLMVLLRESGAFSPPSDLSMRNLYSVTSEQTTYYFAINVLVLILVALLATYLVERLSKTGGALIAAENRAAQAERLAAMGRLAAGLAHEIRNPLSSIAGAVQLLKTTQVDAEDRELCDIVLREAGRLEDLVSDMVDLARPRPPHRTKVDVSRIVADVVDLSQCSGRARGDVQVRRLGTESPLFIDADPAQMRQLIWNLVRNAVQASVSGGEVRVRLDCVKRRVELRVEDDGVGIEPGAQAQMFDASFTTRSQGTGMGLAVVKRIADEHEFPITVKSNAGEGAIFLLDLGPLESPPRHLGDEALP